MRRKNLPSLMVAILVVLTISNVILFLGKHNLLYGAWCMRENTGCHEFLWCRGEAHSECDFYCGMIGSSCKSYYQWQSSHCGLGDCTCWSFWQLNCQNGNFSTFTCGEYDDFSCEFALPQRADK